MVRKNINSTTLTSISNASPSLFTLTAHGLVDGDQIRLTTSGTLPSGLAISTTYWVNQIDANTFNVADSFAHLQSATYVGGGGAGSGTHSFVCSEINIGLAAPPGSSGSSGSSGTTGSSGSSGTSGSAGSRGSSGSSGSSGTSGSAGSSGTSATTVKLTSDLATITSTTVTNTTGLSFSVSSGVYYRFAFQVLYQAAATTTGIKIALTIPSVTTFVAVVDTPVSTAAGGTANIFTDWITASGGTATGTGTPVANSTRIAFIEGTILPSAGGTLQVQHATSVAASTVTIKQGSNGLLWPL